MARPRKYATEAERQAAFRQRSVIVERAGLEELRALLERLQAAIRASARAGDKQAAAVVMATPEATLRRLCEHWETVAAERQQAARLASAGSVEPRTPGAETAPTCEDCLCEIVGIPIGHRSVCPRQRHTEAEDTQEP